MTRGGDRPTRLFAVYATAVLGLGGYLFVVMGVQHDQWLVRSYENRWAFKDVPSVRGSLRDRNGVLLAEDQPTFELDCVYERFRLHHPVGAAVHGATLATRLSGSEVRYSYFGAALSPLAAARALLSLPVGALLYGDMPKAERRELLTAAFALLTATAERSWARVRRELLATAAVDSARPIGDALPGCDLELLAQRFAGLHGRLVALDRELQRAEAAQKGEPSPDDEEAPAAAADSVRGLLQRLDRFRVDSLEQRRSSRKLADGSVREGELLDRIARPVARELPFELAAAVRVAASGQPGLVLEPALRRIRPDDLPPTLQRVLGSVQALDRSPGPGDYLEDRVDAALSGEIDALVPDDLTPLPDYQRALAQEAERSFARALRTRERRGTSGIEAMLDERLRGEPGLRLVEHDVHAREQMLWSSLRVTPGQPVALAIDTGLQALLDERVGHAYEHWHRFAAARGANADRIDVAMAIVEARTGDVLALAGAPLSLGDVPLLPPVLNWRGNGALGSIVKPLFLLEQKIAERDGLPHADLAALEPCAQKYRGKDGRTYRCDHAHWADGTDPVLSLAKSCNSFFFQLAEAMGEPGLRRALWRFGMMPPSVGDGEGRYQARPREIPPSMSPAPRWLTWSQGLPMRGIGYSLEANPLAIARAYAALATGTLPTLGFVAGEARPGFSLGASADDLALVRAGLRECVESGTADEIEALARAGVAGKTGTAEIEVGGVTANNAWFAGFTPPSANGMQLAFCAVVYAVPDKVHGADAAGLLVGETLTAIARDARLSALYLSGGAVGEEGR